MKFKTPYADEVPPMSTEERAALEADIKANGQQVPIDIDEEGNILDGHNRYAILKAKVAYCVIDGLSPAQKLAHVQRKQNTRRNMSPNQRQALRKRQQEIAKMLREENPKRWTQPKIALELGVSQSCVSKWLERSTSVNSIPRNTIHTPPSPTAAAITPPAPEPPRPPDARVKLSKQDKAEIIKRIEAGETQQQVAADYAVDRSMVSKIIKQYNEAKAKAAEAKAKAEAAKALQAAQPKWEIKQGECVDVLAEIPAGTVRLVFADPPYNIGIDYGKGKAADLLADDEYMQWVANWIAECSRILTDDGSLWVMIVDEYAAEYCIALKSAGLTMRSWIKWYETFGVNCTNKFNRCSRHIFYFTKHAKRFVFNDDAVSRPSDRQLKYNDKRANDGGKIWDDVWQIPRLTGTSAERIEEFPTQLPLQLVRAIVGCASDPGDMVVDPFNGSGTTGAACIKLGREYIGIEKETKWLRKSKERLECITPAPAAL